MKRLVVVGGGISGLAAAHTALERSAQPLEVVVLEKEAEVGGKARTLESEGWRVEAGPTGYLDNEPALQALVEAAGLSSQRVTADPAAARRFVVRAGRMREVSAHPLRFAGAGILGPVGLLRMLGEPFTPARRRDEEETVWDFARRRLGRQAADRLVSPMVLGVFAGDSKKLSVEAAFPRLVALEREHGSLVRGMLARRRAGLGGGPTGPGATLTSFAAGLQSLPLALAAEEGLSLRRDSAVRELEQGDSGTFRMAVEGQESLSADAVVLACEAWAAADLLAPWRRRSLHFSRGSTIRR